MLETTYLIHKMGSGLVKDISSSERPKDASRPYRIYLGILRTYIYSHRDKVDLR